MDVLMIGLERVSEMTVARNPKIQKRRYTENAISDPIEHGYVGKKEMEPNVIRTEKLKLQSTGELKPHCIGRRSYMD